MIQVGLVFFSTKLLKNLEFEEVCQYMLLIYAEIGCVIVDYTRIKQATYMCLFLSNVKATVIGKQILITV